MSQDRTFSRRLAWIAGLILLAGFVIGLQVRVTALKSEALLAEKRIVYLKRDKMYLETEFETRANQQQLKAWNDLEFGYLAPRASQYLEGESRLAALGKDVGPGGPAQIRVASADPQADKGAFPSMVSPITGKPLGEDAAPAAPVDHDKAAAELGARLIRVDHKADKKAAKGGKLDAEAHSL